MNEIYIFMISYGGVLIIALLLANILTKGFLFRFITAKIGKRKGKVMVLARGGSLFDYDKVGTLREGWLIYKDRDKAVRRLSVPEECPFNFLGVVFVQVDELKNAVMKRDYNAITGFDAVKYQELYIRALNRSKLNDLKQYIMIILIGVGIILLLGVVNIAVISGLKKTLIPMLQNCDWHTLLSNTTNAGSQFLTNTSNVIQGGNI